MTDFVFQKENEKKLENNKNEKKLENNIDTKV